MSTHITVRSRSAIAIAGFFGLVTTGIVFEDVLRGEPMTTSHGLTASALVAAFAGGIYCWPAVEMRAWFAAGIMLLLATVGSAYIVVGSGSRNATAIATAAEKAKALAMEQDRLMAQRTTAETELAAARRDHAKECKTGKGNKCAGATEILNAAIAALAKTEADIKSLAPVKPPVDYSLMATTLQSWGLGVTAQWLGLNMPIIAVILTELATIGFGHIGFGHVSIPEPETKEEDEIAPHLDPVISWVRVYRARHGRDPEIPQVKQAFPDISRTTAWRRIKAA